MKKNAKKVLLTDVIILILLAIIIIAVSLTCAQDVEIELGLLYPVEAEKEQTGGAMSAAGGGELYVHFVDVGQGDCAVIEFPDGKTMVIDGGENNKSTEQAINTFIQNTLPEDFKYFDYAVLTHPDSDHCGSLDYVLNTYPARVVYRPNVEAVGTKSNPYVDPGKADLTSDAVSKNTAVYANAVKAMYATNADFTPEVRITDPLDDSQTITGGSGDDEYTFDFYTPLSAKYTGEGDWNNYSPVMILEYRGFRYAMSGDAEEQNLDEFVQKISDAKTDGKHDKYDEFTDDYCVNVIKAGHHGSTNATTLDYLNAITSPSGAQNAYCVISCGAGNKYGHPHQAAIDRYLSIGVKQENILRTDEKGDITLSVKLDENGNYMLFYGNKSSGANTPGTDTGEEEKDYVYVYREMFGVKLTFPVVAWTVYAVVAVVLVIHIVWSFSAEDDGGNTGKKSASKKKSTTKRNGR